jgi:hypothetical protein
MPGIHDGSCTMGTRKSSVPGIGTPMRTPTIARTAMINAAILSDQENVAFQGEPSERTFTSINATPIEAIATHVLSKAITPIAVRSAQIQRVKGCSGFFII